MARVLVNTIYSGYAGAADDGALSTGAQTIAGTKTFADSIVTQGTFSSSVKGNRYGSWGNTAPNVIDVLTTATDNTSGVVMVQVVWGRNTSGVGATMATIFSGWSGATPLAISTTVATAVGVAPGGVTASWVGSTLRLSFASGTQFGSWHYEIWANYRGGSAVTIL